MAKGYTKIENELFRFLYSNDLYASELKILLFLIRYTKGFGRDTVRAAYGFIAKGTGYSDETCRKAIRKLIKKGYVQILYPAIGSSAQVLQLLYKNCTSSYPRVGGSLVQEQLDKKVQESLYQDIKEYIKTEDIKNKDIENHSILKETDEQKWERLNQEDFDE